MADLVSRIYKRNLLYQQLNFKWRSFVYLRNAVRTLRCNSSHLPWLSKTLVIFAFLMVHTVDFLLGCVAALMAQRYGLQPILEHGISFYTLTMLSGTKDLVTWLMAVPAGLKLNTALSHFLGVRCLYILELWDTFYADFIATYLSGIVSFMLLLAPFGVTILVSALHDFLKFLNLCLICFFIVTYRVFSLQFTALKSLARLFMGKKWNVLRQRVDSCDYDTSQLLLGTLLFTILLFLVPTTGIFLVIFLVLRMLQFGVQFLLRTVTVLVNKVIVKSWDLLRLSLQDAPITTAKLTVSERCVERKAHGPVRLEIKWNGREYTLDGFREVLDAYPTAKALNELNGEGKQTASDELHSHSMLSWIGGLPL